jgi:mannose-6-phosphate isomerase-like protein (cupin superfamily)
LHRHAGVEEVYYVLNGEGEVTVGTETAAIHKGDAVPLQLGDAHSFRNKGTQDLEFMIIGIAAQKDVLDTQEIRGGGRGGRGGQ